ncbi:capsid cement protein [Pararhizobium gei]|uniref:capsid cement protein n=1 Tax=Pararhizobium gei TaxID=1395951 RepID=UPI0023DC2E05|nr:capsid cement protein [Rhizobium gei]
MQHFHDVLTDTAIPTTLFDAYDLISFNDGLIVADDVAVKGVAKHPCTEIGQPTAVILLGWARVRARGAIAKGDRLISAAAGGVKTAGATPANPFARALTAAADGEFVTILIR